MDWLDSARGAAIVLVVLLHADATANTFDGALDETITSANRVLRHLRMPLFFFCSGVLAHWGLARPWGEVFRKRIAVLGWVIILWSLIYFVLQFYMPVNAWQRSQHPVSRLIIAPFGILWFLYAVVMMNLVMRALQRLALPWQVGAVVLLNALVWTASKNLSLPGYDFLVTNLGLFAIIYFALGYWTAPPAIWLLGSRRRIAISTLVAVVLWLGELVLTQAWPRLATLPMALLSIPDVALGVSLAAMLALWPPTRVMLTWLGSRTLAIFLFHPIFIGLALLVIRPMAVSAQMALAILFPCALLGSLLAERMVKVAGLTWLLRPPALFASPERPAVWAEPRTDP